MRNFRSAKLSENKVLVRNFRTGKLRGAKIFEVRSFGVENFWSGKLLGEKFSRFESTSRGTKMQLSWRESCDILVRKFFWWKNFSEKMFLVEKFQ